MKKTILFFTLLTLSSCFSASAPSRFYMLSSLPENNAHTFNSKVRVGVAPIKVATYLDRKEIVSITEDNRVTFSEFERWAEPLGESIERIVYQNFVNNFGDGNVFLFPWNSEVTLNRKVKITIFKFARMADSALLDAQILVEAKGTPPRVKDLSLSSECKGSEVKDTVDCMNSVLSQLTKQAAELIENSL